MGRVVRNPETRPVSEFEVAPHRYFYNGSGVIVDDDVDYKTWKTSVPYKEGEVIFVQRGNSYVKALIIYVIPTRDRFGFRREMYRCQVETKKGFWSKLWEDFYPGYVQRGYKNAGLAPDVPD